MNTEICKITFPDGAWLKAELPMGDERIEYVLDHFGMFKEIEALPAKDAAAIAFDRSTLIRNEDNEIAAVNGYLESMGQPAIADSFERAKVVEWIRDHLAEAAQYGHSMYDGYEIADNLRDLRQRTLHVVHA